MTALARLRTVWLNRGLNVRYGCPARLGWVVVSGANEPHRGYAMTCSAGLSRLRWVLVGRCGQHGGRRG